MRAEAAELRRWANTLPFPAQTRPLLAAERLEAAADRLEHHEREFRRLGLAPAPEARVKRQR